MPPTPTFNIRQFSNGVGKQTLWLDAVWQDQNLFCVLLEREKLMPPSCLEVKSQTENDLKIMEILEFGKCWLQKEKPTLLNLWIENATRSIRFMCECSFFGRIFFIFFRWISFWRVNYYCYYYSRCWWKWDGECEFYATQLDF